MPIVLPRCCAMACFVAFCYALLFSALPCSALILPRVRVALPLVVWVFGLMCATGTGTRTNTGATHPTSTRLQFAFVIVYQFMSIRRPPHLLPLRLVLQLLPRLCPAWLCCDMLCSAVPRCSLLWFRVRVQVTISLLALVLMLVLALVPVPMLVLCMLLILVLQIIFVLVCMNMSVRLPLQLLPPLLAHLSAVAPCPVLLKLLIFVGGRTGINTTWCI